MIVFLKSDLMIISPLSVNNDSVIFEAKKISKYALGKIIGGFGY
jgi:hypothetical protein